jgi:flagellar basal body-associated protein FliL
MSRKNKKKNKTKDKTKITGFGMLGLVLSLAIFAVVIYFMLDSFKRETAILIPQSPTGTTPIQAAEHVQAEANLQQKSITNALNQAKKDTNSSSN